MSQLLFASRNQGKTQEVAQILQDLSFEVVSLDQFDIPAEFDIDENGDTFEANASLKAAGFGRKAQVLTLADDSGLVVDALDGRPGVYSKRYGNSDAERINRLLQELKDVPKDQRTARFISVVCLYDPVQGQTVCEQGSVEGYIGHEPKGTHGFGYDPIFIPSEGDGMTFAEYGADFKNMYSHRARALEKIKLHLSKS